MKNVLSEFKFWVILGPIVMLAAFLAATLNHCSTFFLLPLFATIGLILSWRFKLYGMGISFFLLFGSLAYYYPFMSADDRFWQVGIGMSFALSCLITALCSDEAEILLKNLENESDNRLEHLRHLDERLKKLKKMSQHEQESREMELIRARQQIAEKEGKIGALEEVIVILREELKALREKISEPSDKENSYKIKEMGDHITNLKREKDLLQVTLGRLQKEMSHTNYSQTL